MINKHNNLQIIRLFLAIQVLLVHSFHHLSGVDLSWLEYFPGVPAFFFLSGFLIYASYLNSPNLNSYIKNRFLRLFPALFTVVFISGVFIYFYRMNHGEFNNQFIINWVFAQATLGQAYNPSQLRDLGVGVFNGSLWTITVEILFYIALPILIIVENKVKGFVFFVSIGSFFLYAFAESMFGFDIAMGKTLYQFINLTPITWGWMFGLGILANRYFHLLKPYIRYFWIAIFPMVFLAVLSNTSVFFSSQGNKLGLFYFILYAALILYVAFHIKPLKLNIDISYGCYIWHMPIVNVLLIFGFNSVLFAVVLTFLFSLTSWFFVEKPALALKKYGFMNVLN